MVKPKITIQALNQEVEEYIQQFGSEVDKNGRRLFIRNGVGRPRKVTIGSGTVEVQAPRFDDRGECEKFFSSILPPYLRKSPKVEVIDHERIRVHVGRLRQRPEPSWRG